MPPLASFLIAMLGWRGAYLALVARFNQFART
jgi:hypothetical protein